MLNAFSSDEEILVKGVVQLLRNSNISILHCVLSFIGGWTSGFENSKIPILAVRFRKILFGDAKRWKVLNDISE
jgi:hypothetical protein